MNKFLNKLLISISSIFMLGTVAYAENTVCYKNNWDSPSTIENIKFDGGKCNGQYSISDMKKMGWNVLDIKINTNQNQLNYSYLLTKDEAENKTIVKSEKKKPVSVNQNKKRFSFKAIGLKLDKVENNKTTIDIGDLTVGQSGVVVHIYDNEKRLIIANAKVTESNSNSSVVEFSKFTDLKQDALPTSKRMAEKDDILVLNYLYGSSLVIAPTQDTFQVVRSNFKYNNFLHSDVFAAKLKNDGQPYPSKKAIQDFAIAQNLGTVFIVVNKNVYVVDVKTFTILTNYPIDYENKKAQKPFYTRVEEIEENSISFSIFSKNNNDLSYEQYYKEILGL